MTFSESVEYELPLLSTPCCTLALLELEKTLQAAKLALRGLGGRVTSGFRWLLLQVTGLVDCRATVSVGKLVLLRLQQWLAHDSVHNEHDAGVTSGASRKADARPATCTETAASRSVSFSTLLFASVFASRTCWW